MHCPCGSTLLFSQCCQPFITNNDEQKLPSSPEQLMRSRFSAYAIKNGQYIFDTYGKAQQVNLTVSDIQSWADECIWVALVIHNTLSNDTINTVEFSAYYIVDNTLCELREVSNFAVEQDKWRYIDGDININREISKVKRNELCPCNHYPTAWSAKKEKKFKHCCGR
ncbi:YchJ family metal-binding protein [Colwellia sp. E2M01]|uniref:YchJ family protein n=1 Tax=Colwellia sp. E2M01 TaxID=2841561 RepID=UPI001C09D38C|nr:YchJ family metal-binding protein [Colwellia sp. E2M01]MBU2871266.1 SecC motif-containing protein [Colwellia sp. E2M01]